jgi:hypothetical protein
VVEQARSAREMEYGIEVNLRRALADVPGIAARLYPRSKLRWSGPDECSEDACKMAGILKPGAHPRFEDAGFGVPQILLCPLNSLQKDVPVGSLPGAPPEHLDEVVRAHTGDRRKVQKGKVIREVVADIVQYALQSICR